MPCLSLATRNPHAEPSKGSGSPGQRLPSLRAGQSAGGRSFPGALRLSQGVSWRARDQLTGADILPHGGDRAAKEPESPKVLSQEAQAPTTLFLPLPFSPRLQEAIYSLLRPLSIRQTAFWPLGVLPEYPFPSCLQMSCPGQTAPKATLQV